MTEIVKTDRKTWLKWGLAVVIAIGILLIPTSEYFTSELRLFLSISAFFIALVAMELIDTILCGILLPTFYLITGVAPVDVAFSGWTNTTTFLVIGAFVMAFGMEDCGLLQRVAYALLSKVGTTYNKMLYGLLITGIILGYLTFGNHQALLLTFAFGICIALHYEQRSTEGMIIMLVAALGCLTSRTASYFPNLHAPLVAGAQAVIPDFTIPWIQPLIMGWPIYLFCFFLVWLMTKVFKTKNFNFAGGKAYFVDQLSQLGKMTGKEKKCALIVGVVLILLLTKSIHGIPEAYIFMTMPYLFFLPGVNIASKKTIKRLPFGIFFLITACFSIGSVGVSLNVQELITHTCTPLLQNANSIVVMYFAMFIGAAANMFLTPAAIMTCLSAPVAQIATDLAMNPIGPLTALYYSSDLIILPHEAVNYLMMYSFGMLSMGKFAKMMSIKLVLFVIFFTVILVPYWYLLGVL